MSKTGKMILKIIIIILVLAFAGWIAWDNSRIVLTTITVKSERLPGAFDGYRIAQVSDLHNDEFGENNEKLITLLVEAAPDMIAIPGDTKATTISGIIADEMAIGMVNQKTTAVRLIPVIGKGVGESVEFGGLFGYAPIMPVNEFDCSAFIERKGRIPAPIHSFKN